MAVFVRGLILFCLIGAMVLLPRQAAADDPARRGLFVSVLDHKPVLSSREDMLALVRFAKQAGVKLLFVQVYRGNKTWFPSKVGDASPYQACLTALGQDPLAFLIKEAHREGIQVHAWLNLLSLSKNADAKMLKKYGPGILTRNNKPKKLLNDYLIDNQYFLEPGDARVRRELLNLVGELVQAYPTLDGIQFDYIRYPDVKPYYGHGEAKRFRRESGVGKITEDNPRWRQWKRDQVTDLVKMLTQEARRLNPAMQVSTTGCVSYVRAREEAFQDWPVWVNARLVDFVTIMSYPPDLVTFKKNVADALKRVEDPLKLNFAIGAYKFINDAQAYQGQFDWCKETKAGGCSVFHYDSLRASPALAQITIDEGK